jgi:hypothetical protein
MFQGKAANHAELVSDDISVREVSEAVADIRMGHAREEWRHDPKGADSESLNALKRQEQVAGIVTADAGQLEKLVIVAQG